MTIRIACILPALAYVHREYPNKIAHILSGDADVRPPRELTPVFCGCFDWHSAVRGHWLLAPHLRSVSPRRKSRRRPPIFRAKREAAARIRTWLPKLRYPIRVGEHAQTAFAFSLIRDWALVAGDTAMRDLIDERSRSYYLADVSCPLDYEPSGEDFLSPCLAEADLMRRILSREEFAAWLTQFLPRIPGDGTGNWLEPAIVTDRSDPKLGHIDGLNLSRAWMLCGIASALPEKDPRRAALEIAAARHGEAALPAVTGEHYAGGHWLGSFAVYLLGASGPVAGVPAG